MNSGVIFNCGHQELTDLLLRTLLISFLVLNLLTSVEAMTWRFLRSRCEERKRRRRERKNEEEGGERKRVNCEKLKYSGFELL
jgi:hypothetical protein